MKYEITKAGWFEMRYEWELNGIANSPFYLTFGGLDFSLSREAREVIGAKV